MTVKAVFEGIFHNFNAARKKYNVYHSSLMEMVSKTEMRVKKQLI